MKEGRDQSLEAMQRHKKRPAQLFSHAGRIFGNSCARQHGSSLECDIWLPVLRTQRNIASGWHIMPVFCNSTDRNVIYTIAPPNKPEKAMPASPVALALAFQQMLEDGEVNNQSHLARKVGLTRARVTQILNLLKLPDSVIRNLCSISEPKKIALFSERRLRSITRLPRAKEQIKAFHDLDKESSGNRSPVTAVSLD